MDYLPSAQTFSRNKVLLKPHYLINILLASSFFVLKVAPYACEYLFEVCDFELRELELVTFLGCVLAFKTRKDRGSMIAYLGTLCMFTKLLSIFLYGRHSVVMAIIYVVLCLIHLVFFPSPATYAGPDSVTYFRGVNLDDELNKDKRVVWLVAFYAPWSPPCVSFADVFSKISYDYSLDNMKFGKLDASRYQDVATKFRVDGTSWSKQLPTLIMFENGKEKMRRPFVDHKRTVQKFSFTEKNIKDHFQLNEVYKNLKANPIKKSAASHKSSQDKKTD